MAWVYMLECADGSYYVGSTGDIEGRVYEHQRGIGSRYTSKRLPVRLVWAGEFESVVEAWGFERRLHGWGRAKRRALIDDHWDEIKRLARPKTSDASPGSPCKDPA